MHKIRRGDERGHFDHGWLNTYHTFSFAGYRDPAHMGFRTLRVINEDYVQKADGFDTHPHNDMEIITYILEGELEHKDSMGTGSVIRVGDVQRMSAGTGVTHSEFNHSKDHLVHLLQIWILPEKKGIKPGYEQKHFSKAEKLNKWRLVASRDGREGSVKIHQDAELMVSVLENGKSLERSLNPKRHYWMHVARGEVSTPFGDFKAGDAIALNAESSLKIKDAGSGASGFSEILLFDLA